MSYCIYLRKSRKDIEAEQHGEGETLARHEQSLLALAKRQGLIISAIYREVVSGETISARPVMQQLLKEVESDMWDGVLVMEVERLARGDTVDQGTVQRAFQYSNTLIVTPSKTYDPVNEFDQEYFEFGLFMSRREYKTIKRRMQNGRYAAVREGKWPYNQAPYGWKRIKLEKEKGWTLEPHPDEAPVVQLIFNLATEPGRMGVSAIRHYLNSNGVPTRRGGKWTDSTVVGILTNQVNDKKVGIGYRKIVTHMENGVPVKSRPRTDRDILVEGRQPRLISHGVFQEVQGYIGQGTPKPPESYGIKNPLSGLIVCSECGLKMQRKPASLPSYKNGSKYDILICKTDGCPTVASAMDVVEKALIDALANWVDGYKLESTVPKSRVPELDAMLKTTKEAHADLTRQKSKLYDLLEQGIYTTEVFLERSEALQNRISDSEAGICSLEKEIAYERKRDANITNFLPACNKLLDHYWDLSVPDRNKALKMLLDSVEYKKQKKNGHNKKDEVNFTLTLKPRIPRK